MIGLLYYEFKSSKSFIAVIAFSIFFGVSTVLVASTEASKLHLLFQFVISTLLIMSSSTIASANTKQSEDKWTTYILSCPVTRKELLLVKFISSTIIITLSAIISYILNIFYCILSGTNITMTCLYIPICVMTICFVLNSINIPMIFHMGIQKAGLVQIIAFIIFAVCIMFYFMFGDLQKFSNFCSRFTYIFKHLKVLFIASPFFALAINFIALQIGSIRKIEV